MSPLRYLLLALLLIGARPAAAEPQDYLLGPQDTLQITVFGHDEFNREVQVLPDGTIAYPMLGEARVAGMTVAEVTRLVADSLRRELLRPQVTVAVTHAGGGVHRPEEILNAIMEAVK